MTGQRRKGKVALVTAGASGIGREIVRQLLAEGASLIVADIDEAAMAALPEELGIDASRLTCIRCDISDADDVAALANLLAERMEPVDYLFNHAGISAAGPFQDIPIAAWEQLVRVNLIGTVRVTQALLPAMIARGGGHIINTASTLALFGDSAWHAPYIATKSAIIGMSRALARQLAPSGLRVTIFCPDLTRTGFHRFGALHGMTAGDFRDRFPPAVRQEPADVARELLDRFERQFIVSLASDTTTRLHDQIDLEFGSAQASAR